MTEQKTQYVVSPRTLDALEQCADGLERELQLALMHLANLKWWLQHEREERKKAATCE